MPLSLFHLHGDLKDLRFPRLLAALREDEFTGVFQASVHPDGSENDITREVHFLEGSIAWAISTDPEESLRSYLLRNGAITEPQWLQAEEKARDSTLRQALVELGMVGSDELTQIERGRAEEIVLALFTADRGEYRVRERQLAPGTPHLKIDPRVLILKGVLEGGDRALILEEIGSLDTVYVVKRPVIEEAGLNLPGEFQSVLRLIDGKRSVAQICSLLSMPDYFICSVFAALSMVGAVRGSHARSASAPRKPAIVRGAEVAASPAPPARSAPERVEEPAVEPASLAGSAAEPSDAGPVEPIEEIPAQEPAAASPVISTAPFDGEGPVTPLDTIPTDDEEILEVEVLEEPEAEDIGPRPSLPEAAPAPQPRAPEPVPMRPPAFDGPPLRPAAFEPPARPATPEPPPVRPAPADPAPSHGAPPRRAPISIPSPPVRPRADRPAWTPSPPPQESGRHEMADERSRPWFLLGGAMAVGAAALFLILMAQGSGDAGETLPLSADPTLQTSPAPSRPAQAEEGDEGAAPDSPDTRAASVPTPASPVPKPSAVSEPVKPPERVESPRRSPMLEKSDDEQAGRERLLAGDYRAAARHFGRQVSEGPGGYTVQLLMACQDDTVRRAVENGRSSPELFILSTTFQGRSCYRVYWGRYPSQKRAQEAMLRDIPSAFIREKPRVTRLAGS